MINIKNILFFLTILWFNNLSAQQNDLSVNELLNLNLDNLHPGASVLTIEGNIESDPINKEKFIVISNANSKENLYAEIQFFIPNLFYNEKKEFKKIKGKELELSGTYKFQDEEDTTLKIRLIQEKNNRELTEKNINFENLNGYGDWVPFQINSALEDSLLIFKINIEVTGKSKIWLDDLNVSVDGNSMEQSLTYLFESDKDHQFDHGSEIKISGADPDLLNDLFIFSKVWGFLKYYHPKVSRGDMNWDYEMFRILPSIYKSAHTTERKTLITQWISTIDTHILITDDYFLTDSANIHIYPALDWINDTELLGEELSNKLREIKSAARNTWHYYLQFDDALHNLYRDRFPGEKIYPHISWEDQGYRLLTLLRYWNVIEYCYPYKELIIDNWDTVLKNYLEIFLTIDSEKKYLDAIYSLIAEINDSHAYHYYPYPHILPIRFSYIEGEVIVNTSYSCQIQSGDIILEMDNKTINEIIEERSDFISASNKERKLDFIINNLNFWDKDTLDVKYIRNKDTIATVLTDFNLIEAKEGCTTQINKYDYNRVLSDNNIMYLFLPELNAPYLTLLEDSLLKSKGLILDFRSYPTDDSFYDKLADLLFPYPVEYMKIALLDVEHPGVFRLIPTYSEGRINPHAYVGKIVILANSKTQSAAETAVMMFQKVPGAITIGTQSSAANGNVSFLFLPNGFRTIFTGMGCYYPDFKNVQGEGVQIDHLIYPTRKLFLEGRDDMIEKAIELINN